MKKVVDGTLYDPNEPAIMQAQNQAVRLLERFNQVSATDSAEQTTLLQTMFAEFGAGSTILPPLHANWGGKFVHFGQGVFANFNLTLVDDTEIYVGNHVMFGPNVTLDTGTHPLAASLRRQGLQYNLPIHIGDNVWLGAGVTVLPGVTIGENSVIGAGSLVTKDIPANVVAFGTPCRFVRALTDEEVTERK